ncbi:MAG: hypothetical protein JWO31_333, partial [Phycisphaerales bacterium]|nr:hypothetical protein [Phycisphaerales bacterium]
MRRDWTRSAAAVGLAVAAFGAAPAPRDGP